MKPSIASCLLLLALLALCPHKSAAQIELGMDRGVVMQLAKDHPEWEVYDQRSFFNWLREFRAVPDSVVVADNSFDTVPVLDSAHHDFIAFQTIPIGGVSGHMFVHFDSRDVVERITWSYRRDTLQEARDELEQDFLKVKNYLTTKLGTGQKLDAPLREGMRACGWIVDRRRLLLVLDEKDQHIIYDEHYGDQR